MEFREAVRTVKERLNIADIVGRYVTLKRNGPRWMAPCPFHQETKPSFTVNEERGMFYCFGCHAAGDVFEFYSRINGIGFRETLEQLAGEIGISVDRGPGNEAQDARAREERSARQQMLRMYELAAAHFASALRSPSAAECRAYVEKRGLSDAIVARFGLGWAPREWHDLDSALRRAGFDMRLAGEAGLVGMSEQGKPYDRFRGRLIFPIKSLSNQIIAFGGRIIGNEDEAKYINSSDTPIYKKGEHLYGLAQARRGVTTKGRALLTEGYMDVLTLHQFGYDNAVGVLGTALTTDQVKRLMGFTSKISLLFDGDNAGRKAALRSCGMLLTRGLSCTVVLMPEGEDIDSLLRGAGPEAFEELQANAPEGLDYCLGVMRGEAPRDAIAWAKEFLHEVEVPELASPFMTRIARGLGISERELRQDVAVGARPSGVIGQAAPMRMTARAVMEGEVLRHALRYPADIDALCGLGADLVIGSDVGKRLWDKLLAHGEETYQYLDERERRFWVDCCGPEASPCVSGAREFGLLRDALERWFRRAQTNSFVAALQAGGNDLETDLEFFRAADAAFSMQV